MRAAALIVLVYGAAIPAKADLVNGNFSGAPNPSETVSSTGPATIPSWTVLHGSVYWVGNLWVGPPGGGDSVDLDGGSAGAIYQYVNTVAGDNYTLSFYLAGDPLGDPGIKQLNVIAGGNSAHFTFDTAGLTVSNMGWTLETVDFVASQSSTLIAFLDGNSSLYGPVIGGLSVVDPPSMTPEPGLFGPLALGLAGLSYVAFRRRRG